MGTLIDEQPPRRFDTSGTPVGYLRPRRGDPQGPFCWRGKGKQVGGHPGLVTAAQSGHVRDNGAHSQDEMTVWEQSHASSGLGGEHRWLGITKSTHAPALSKAWNSTVRELCGHELAGRLFQGVPRPSDGREVHNARVRAPDVARSRPAAPPECRPRMMDSPRTNDVISAEKRQRAERCGGGVAGGGRCGAAVGGEGDAAQQGRLLCGPRASNATRAETTAKGSRPEPVLNCHDQAVPSALVTCSSDGFMPPPSNRRQAEERAEGAACARARSFSDGQARGASDVPPPKKI
ncbi:unnamed protein product [Lampetra fluviatilis]